MATSSRKGSGNRTKQIKSFTSKVKKRKKQKQRHYKEFIVFIASMCILGFTVATVAKQPVQAKAIHITEAYEYTPVIINTDNIPKRKPTPPKLVKATDQRSVDCMAKNLFYEARGTNKWEMIRVANVTMNRVNSKVYPSTVCEVVYQYKQFSWTLIKHRVTDSIHSLYKAKGDLAEYDLAKDIANRAVANDLPDLTGGAMWYHTHKVNPKWNKQKEVTYASNWHRYYKK